MHKIMLTNTFVLYFYFGISQQPISKSFAKSFATIVANPQNHIDTYICIQYIVFLFWHFPAAYCEEFCEKFCNNCCKCTRLYWQIHLFCVSILAFPSSVLQRVLWKVFATIVANAHDHIDKYICIVSLFWHFPAAYCKEFCEKFLNNCCKCTRLYWQIHLFCVSILAFPSSVLQRVLWKVLEQLLQMQDRGTSRRQKLWPILRTINNKRRSRYICRNNPKYLKITIKGVVDKFAETTQNICNNKKQ